MGLRFPSLVYPGAPGIMSASYTNSHGTRPGIVELTVHPDLSQMTGFGDLTLTDGTNTTLVRNCRVINGRAQISLQGYYWTIYLEDGRWPLRYGTIQGHYNQLIPRVFDTPRVPNYGDPAVNPVAAQLAGQSDQFTPPIQEWSRKNARDLAVLLFDAMGVADYDVSNIPNDQYPEVNWDVATACQELDRLADLYGCRVCYDHEKGFFTIARLGVGADLPPAYGDELQRDGIGVDPPEAPARIRVYGSERVYQVRFTLEAVGMDFDGQYKPKDEVSYRPKDGWQRMPPPFYGMASDSAYNMGQLPGTRTIWEAMSLAQQSIYRAYRIKETLPYIGPDIFRFPPDSSHTEDEVDRFHIILQDFLPEGTYDDLGQRSLMPPRVYGRALRLDTLQFAQTAAGELVKATFSIDPIHRVILFDTHICLNEQRAGDTEALWYPADIVLECACTLLNADAHYPERWSMAFNVGGAGTGGGSGNGGRPDELGIIRDEIRYFERIDYTTTNEVNTRTSNQSECENKANWFYQGELARFQTTTPQDRVYNGIKRGIPDGAIQQVSYNVSMSGATTQMTRNNEHSVYIPPYALRRQAEIGTAENMSQQRARVDNIRRRVRGDDPFAA